MAQRSLRNYFNKSAFASSSPTSSSRHEENTTHSVTPAVPGTPSMPSKPNKKTLFQQDTSSCSEVESSKRSSPHSVKKQQKMARTDDTPSLEPPTSSMAAKRAKFLQVLGEEDYIAAGKDGAWAQARKNIEWLHPSKVRDGNGRRPGEVGYDKRTVTIPKNVLEGKSKSQRQYWETKCQYMDTILFFKVGKFYELYELDAEIGHRELDWKLTISGVGKCLQVGVPESGVDEAVRKLVARGYKVGRMEQIETGEEAKARRGPQAMVKRVLTQVETPATMIADSLQPEAVHLLSIKEVELSTAGASCQGEVALGGQAVVIGFCFMDAAAGRFFVGSFMDDATRSALSSLLVQICPQEILYELGGLSLDTRKALRLTKGPGLLPIQVTPLQPGTEFLEPSEAVHFLQSLDAFRPAGSEICQQQQSLPAVFGQLSEGGGDGGLAATALAAMAFHLKRINMDAEILPHAELAPYHMYDGALRLDGQTVKNLELLENADDGSVNGTLFQHLDSCATPSGKRLLRRWICHPLLSVPAILDRQDAVQDLMAHPAEAAAFWEASRKLPDLERLVARVRALQTAAPVLLAVPAVAQQNHQRRLKCLATAVRAVGDAQRVLSGLRSGLEGMRSSMLAGMLRSVDSGEAWEAMASILSLIVLHSNTNKFSIALEQEDSSGASEEDKMAAQSEALNQLLSLFNQHTLTWQSVAMAIATIDVLVSFAATASSADGATCRPTFSQRTSKGARDEDGGATLKAEGLWHPYALSKSGVVANDVALGGQLAPRAMLLTGPNMGGKSTLLRATCIAVIMAQMGCQAPAQALHLSPADTIFTRLGASDRIIAGESTFMVECNEASSVLRNATPDSLVVLDELGRGTSTFDGYAIAYSVLKHMTERVDCRLLFATHYHPLTAEFAQSPRISLRHMACLFRSTDSHHSPADSDSCAASDQLVFLYKLREGACPKSYGLQVASLAGIPDAVVRSAGDAAECLQEKLDSAFERATYRGGFDSLHNDWLKGILSCSKDGSHEDALDTLYCIWAEIRKSAI